MPARSARRNWTNFAPPFSSAHGAYTPLPSALDRPRQLIVLELGSLPGVTAYQLRAWFERDHRRLRRFQFQVLAERRCHDVFVVGMDHQLLQVDHVGAV